MAGLFCLESLTVMYRLYRDSDVSRLIEEQALMPIVPIVPAAAEGVIIVKKQSLLLKYGTCMVR